jgi:hypothetical protein
MKENKMTTTKDTPASETLEIIRGWQEADQAAVKAKSAIDIECTNKKIALLGLEGIDFLVSKLKGDALGSTFAEQSATINAILVFQAQKHFSRGKAINPGKGLFPSWNTREGESNEKDLEEQVIATWQLLAKEFGNGQGEIAFRRDLANALKRFIRFDDSEEKVKIVDRVLSNTVHVWALFSGSRSLSELSQRNAKDHVQSLLLLLKELGMQSSFDELSNWSQTGLSKLLNDPFKTHARHQLCRDINVQTFKSKWIWTFSPELTQNLMLFVTEYEEVCA